MFANHVIKVVIPALNEEASIGKVLSAVPEWVDEVLVVDNGSTDATARVAAEGDARVIREPRRGYGRACQAGIAALDGCDVLAFLDADLSDCPGELRLLVEPIVAGEADMVIGSRTTGRRAAGALTSTQRFGNALACGIMNLLLRTRHTDLGPFRAIRRSCLRRLGMTDAGYGWTIEMQIKAARAGLRVREVPVRYRRRIGRSKISGTVHGAVGAGAKILWTLARYGLAPPPRPCRRDRLIVFARFPSPGKAKTRLIPAIGPTAAALLQREMTAATLRTVESLRNTTDLEVRYAGGSWRQMRRWLGPVPRYTPQPAGDLGRRMERSLREAFDDGCERVVLIGTDCPALSAGHVRAAFHALADHDAVLGPSDDGGYWLIGLRAPADVFADIPWSTPDVLARTLERGWELGLSTELLAKLADVDTPEDMEMLGAARGGSGPYISVIVPALNEADRVAAAVKSARFDAVEVLVVDGGSDDETAKRAGAAGASVLTCPAGRARQMNFGAARARGQVLVFLHADTVLPVGYAAMVFEAMSDPAVVGGAFEHRTDYRTPVMSVLEWLVRVRSRYLHVPYGDQGLFVRREIFNTLGGFPDLPLAEDLWLVEALRRRGRLAILPAPAVTSGRRWRRLGPIRTTLINQLVLAGYHLGVPADLLARLYVSTGRDDCKGSDRRSGSGSSRDASSPTAEAWAPSTQSRP